MGSSQVLLTAAQVAARSSIERVLPSRPRTAQDVPRSAADLTDEWLTAVLCRDVPGARVVGHEIHGGSDGTSSRRAVTVAYDEAGTRAGLPTALFAKSAASFQSRLFLVLSGVTESETIFYRDIRPELDRLRSPRAFHAASDRRRYRSIVLMEDLAVEGWSFPDPMSESLSLADAEAMVDQMAYYHAAYWGDPRLEQRFGLPTTAAFQERLNQIGIEKRALVGIERARDLTPERLRRRESELLPAVMRALRRNSAGTQTLLHQDVHQGNWMRDPSGRLGLYDWQAVARGEWALDVSYALAVNLTVEDRRAWERGLLERYLERLGEEGVADPPSFDGAWLRYRQQPFHVVVFALLTIGAGRLQPDMQPRDYMRRCWHRIATFVDDHESLDALDEPDRA
ncbi:phosphotransferase [Patulibacter brassicae]|uniref:Phosphotransferase n=1 Tax=Patulibacter brassicae TaxID=1705717 RepID=A0ABU4VEX8_9ACTN|nr:phosphotransferase [Patulibacter brassicae]MDX8150357.1 phosphotransferase [Patulibacter brassicae]